jgi:hypothetical protein
MVWKEAKLKTLSVEGQSSRSHEVSEHPYQAPSSQTFQGSIDSLVHPELAFRAISHLLIVFLSVILVVLSLVSMWKENRFGWPLRGIIWFTVAIIGSCAVIALLAGYVQKTRSLEKVSHRVQTSYSPLVRRLILL